MFGQNAPAMDWLVWGIPIDWGGGVCVPVDRGVLGVPMNWLIMVISVDSVVWVMNWTGSLDWVGF